ncbi:SDR family oxidoreductase [Acidothermaceae bacterium B102]|nr:SDR family oxidoreductase [Acidothermaceae bacterium B102]
MSNDLTGTTALVTGSTHGIGRATADVLAARGAHVIVSGRNAERGEQAVAEIRAAGGKADFVQADLRDAASARSLAQQAIEVGGQVDILVNNAGIYSFGPTAETDEGTYDQTFDVNVKVPYFLVAELAPLMAERGHGSVVNITTAAAEKGLPGGAMYGSTKAALNLLTKSWSAEFGPRGVRVNSVSPGPIYTPGTADMTSMIEALGAGTPSQRAGQAHEVASVVAFVVSDDAAYVHGAVLAVDGGAAAV